MKKAFQRLFPSSQQTKVREEFAYFVVGLEDFADMSALEERSTMDPIKWWTCHGANGVYLQSLASLFYRKWQALNQQKGIGAPMVSFIQ